MIILILLVTLILGPQPQACEPNGIAIHLYDESEQGVQANITLQSLNGTTVYTKGQTDTNGMLTICTLIEKPFRVKVEGTYQGKPLIQIGQDEKGIRINPRQGMIPLNLRIERDGSIIPDPATMISLTGEDPRAATSTASSTSGITQTSPSSTAQPTRATDENPAEELATATTPDTRIGAGWQPMYTIYLLLAVIIGVVLAFVLLNRSKSS